MENRVHSRHVAICQWILDTHFPKGVIFRSNQWKDYNSMDVESVKNEAKGLHSIGGMSYSYGVNDSAQPSRFLCLLTRCVQGNFDQKDMETFISDKDSVNVRALGAFYMRLLENRLNRLKQYLEPLSEDRMPIYMINKPGEIKPSISISAFVTELMEKRTLFGVTFPHLKGSSVSLNSEMRARETSPSPRRSPRSPIRGSHSGDRHNRRENGVRPSPHDRECHHDNRERQLESNERGRRAEDRGSHSDHHREHYDGKKRAENQHENERGCSRHNGELSVNRYSEERRHRREDISSHSDQGRNDKGVRSPEGNHRENGRGKRSRNDREAHDSKDCDLNEILRDDRTHVRPRIEILSSRSPSEAASGSPRDHRVLSLEEPELENNYLESYIDVEFIE